MSFVPKINADHFFFLCPVDEVPIVTHVLVDAKQPIYIPPVKLLARIPWVYLYAGF